MKRFAIIIAILLAVASPTLAQNNPYEIDDECFKYFEAAELSVGDISTTIFEENVEKLLSTALSKQDTKAQTLYYVMKLRRTATIGRWAPIEEREKWNKEVDDAVASAQSVARSTGYTQYYYYAYELAQTYYYNTLQSIKAMEILTAAMNEAREEGNEYGLWKSLHYIAKLYVRQSDNLSARPYLLEALKIKETSTDPTILRQPLSRLYQDLADTYEPASDSCRMFIAKAIETAEGKVDSTRCIFYKALIAAWDGDLEQFRQRRAEIPGATINHMVANGSQILNFMQRLMEDAPDKEMVSLLDSLQGPRSKYIAYRFAESRGRQQLALKASDFFIDQLSFDLANIGSQRLGEFSARYGNNKLSMDLAKSSQKMARITTLVGALLTLLLMAALLFVWLHMRQLQKANERDEQHIAELQEANEKICLADEAKTRFVQNMSHEVRTPLNAITGFSQLLALPDGTFPEAEKEEFASHIVNNTKMLTMLLDDILNATSMDSGSYRITYEPSEMNFMAQAAISSSEHRLQSGVRMFYEPESSEPFTFTTDSGRVQQILINLLTNACKHTQQGEIKLTSSVKERPGYVTYAVTDTGSGVPANQAEAIFERFAKLNDFVQGTGLGLSICREIADKMGARVYLDTTHTAPGARFVFEVPVTPPNQPTAPLQTSN